MPKDSQPDNKKARMEKCNYQTPITEEGIAIGKYLMLSPTFPPLHTVHANFSAHGVPSKLFRIFI
jgi:hypothetical protein